MPFWGGAASGIPPFMVMQEILGADIKFDGDAWAGISEDAVDFVDKLLDRDFNTRMTAEQVGFCGISRLMNHSSKKSSRLYLQAFGPRLQLAHDGRAGGFRGLRFVPCFGLVVSATPAAAPA